MQLVKDTYVTWGAEGTTERTLPDELCIHWCA